MVLDTGDVTEGGRTDSDGEPQPLAIAERLAAMIERNPAVRDAAIDVGVIDPNWLADPSNNPPRIAPPIDVLRRWLERVGERHPSALSALGVGAVQLLSWDVLWNRGLGPRSKDTPNVATVVFVDIEGFTAFTATNGDDAALELLAEHQRVAAGIVRRNGGRIVKHLGDGLMLVFPDAGSGMRAAVELVEAPPGPLKVRAGMHTGQVIVTADDLIGHVVNTAARVTDTARGGQVLVTGDTLDHAGATHDIWASKPKLRALRGVTAKIPIARAERLR
jgi:adenylate cyclase